MFCFFPHWAVPFPSADRGGPDPPAHDHHFLGTTVGDTSGNWCQSPRVTLQTSPWVTNLRSYHNAWLLDSETEVYGANNTEQIKLSLSLGDWLRVFNINQIAQPHSES
jgi:hypothetical protein